MNRIVRDFISDENRQYNFKFGQLIASSLSGFICGAVVATIIWLVALKYFSVF